MLLMRNGFAHITSSESLFKTRPPKILNHPKRRKKRRKKTFGLFLSPSKKKGLFRSFCLLFLVFSFSVSLFPISSFIYHALLLLPAFFFFRERGKERERKRERRSTKIREERVERHDHFHHHDALKKKKSSAISFILITTSSSPPLTLHLLRSRYI